MQISGMGVLKNIIVLGAIGAAGYVGYDFYEAGLFTRPDMPENSFSLSFNGGPFVIMVDLPDERLNRRYAVIRPRDVPRHLARTWGYCESPSQDWLAYVESSDVRPKGTRFDAVCQIDQEGDIIDVGLIFSMPR